MIWLFPAFGLLLLGFFYFRFLASSFWVEGNFIYWGKHLLKKKSILNIAYFGSICNIDHPHIDYFAFAYIVDVLLELVIIFLAILATVLKANQTDGFFPFFFIVILGLMLITIFVTLLVTHFQVKRCEKDFKKKSQEQLDKIRFQIEQQWPDFFK